jgi:protocatechuate 3,4-dioxygenase beta subunit
MRFSVIFLSCLPLTAQGLVVSGPLVSATSNAPAAEQPPTPPEDLGTVEGSVVNAITGGPVKKAAVVMNRTDVQGRVNVPPPSYTTVTDASGNFAMKGLEPGKYQIRVTRNGFVPATYGARGANRAGTTVTLNRAQSLKDINFRLTPHGVVSGQIVDEDGDPMAFVNVQLAQFQVRQARQQVNMVGGNATTNDLGEFRIFGVAPGKYYLQANERNSGGPFSPQDRSATAQPEESYVPSYYPGVFDSANATPIAVAAGSEVTGINLTMRKTTTVHVKGVVSNIPAGSRQPVQVLLLPRGRGFPGGPRNFAAAKGTFDIRGVTPGQYSLAAILNEEGQNYSAFLPVDVGSLNLENLNLSLSAGVDIPGKIRIEGDGPQSMATVNVNLLPRDESLVFGGAGSNGTKDDNTFVLKNVGAGVFRVNVFGLPDGFYVKSIKSGQIEVQVDGLDMTRGAPSLLDILVSPHAGAISGTVQNPNTGRPASGALVVLVPEEKERRGQQQFYRNTTTDQNGSYVVKNIPPGEYKAFAWEDIDPGAYTDPDFLKPFESKGEVLTITESDQKSVTLTMIPADAPPPAQ